MASLIDMARPDTTTNMISDSRRQQKMARADGLVLGQLTGAKGPAPGVPTERRKGKDRRRKKSLHAFIYGNFRPRRRTSRRATDAHEFVFDWHEPHTMYVALAIVLLSCVDALFTLNLLTIGAIEANLFMDDLLSIGVEPFLWTKISLTVVSVVALVFAAKRHFMGWFRVLRVLHLILPRLYRADHLRDLPVQPYPRHGPAGPGVTDSVLLTGQGG